MTLNLDFSIDKARRVLGYSPRVDFQDGIVEALDDITGKVSQKQPQGVASARV
jgi:nucleoside-diphosphate-sugar epimerase